MFRIDRTKLLVREFECIAHGLEGGEEIFAKSIDHRPYLSVRCGKLKTMLPIILLVDQVLRNSSKGGYFWVVVLYFN